MCARIWRENGPLGFYNGLSAALFRQITYSTTRFGVYQVMKENWPAGHKVGNLERIFMATVAGTLGGIAGNPGDICNVRMQNDNKLPVEQRRK